jgi:protein arginine kinase activator
LRDFRREGVLGCPQDYEVFAETLAILIERAHGGKTRHCGKIPSSLPQDAQQRIKQSRLQDALQAAVQREEYELAARLRDQINQMEKGDSQE